MTGHLTVGIDGSRGSDRALEWAAAQAHRSGVELEIVYAYSVPWDRSPFGSPAQDAIEKYCGDLLAAAERRAEKAAPGLVINTRSESGSATAVLLEASKDAVAIVVGARGRGGAVGTMIGSVGTRLATTAHCPVYVVPDRDGLPTTGPVVIGVDDSECGFAAMRLARAEAARRQTFVRAVRAYQTPVLMGPVEPEILRRVQRFEYDSAATVVDDVCRRTAHGEGADVDIRPLMLESPPDDAVLKAAEDAQLIVVGSHGKHLAGRLLLGSVSRLVLQDAGCPVAVVKYDH